ncbi:hypothetical protein [Delftia sp. ASV31]|uniref:hypothetical protein n=1 Tax=Delftia sp. ASV31 TaxID=2795113 RepID=UPI0018ED2A9C|nr:hypothetical protein [Delftia sp. ASV31]
MGVNPDNGFDAQHNKVSEYLRNEFYCTSSCCWRMAAGSAKATSAIWWRAGWKI